MLSFGKGTDMDGSTAESALMDAGVQLAVFSGKNIAGSVPNRFQAIRTKKNLEEVCNSYEEIINELVAERSQVLAIAQAYESELKRYTLGDKDIEHLRNTASAALDVMSTFAPDADLQSFESLKALISVDTLKAMQLLGFDYKKAIGDPLTVACARAITNSLGGAKGNEGDAKMEDGDEDWRETAGEEDR